MTPYEAYLKYLALKMHFTSDYDYVKYQGKVRAKIESFEKRKDKYFFHKLSKKDDLEKFLVYNLFINPDIWVGDLFDERAQEIFNEFERRHLSLSYIFKNEAKMIDDLNVWIKTSGEYPKLYSEYKRGKISPEFMIIMNGVLNIFPYWNRNVSDTVIFPTTINTLEKYKPFVKYDTQKYKEILKQIFSVHDDKVDKQNT